MGGNCSRTLTFRVPAFARRYFISHLSTAGQSNTAPLISIGRLPWTWRRKTILPILVQRNIAMWEASINREFTLMNEKQRNCWRPRSGGGMNLKSIEPQWICSDECTLTISSGPSPWPKQAPFQPCRPATGTTGIVCGSCTHHMHPLNGYRCQVNKLRIVSFSKWPS